MFKIYQLLKEVYYFQSNMMKNIDESIPMEGITYSSTDTINVKTSGRLALFNILEEDYIDDSCMKFQALLQASWDESAYDTMKILFYLRDCHSGKRFRESFIIAMIYISQKYPEWFEVNFKHIPSYGRWLDLIEIYRVLYHDYHKDLIVAYLSNQLIEDQYNMDEGEAISFLAKWIPSENKKYDRNSNINEQICKKLFHVDNITSYTLKRYRKEFISPLRQYMQLCETQMCNNKWDDINYSCVPVIAMKKYYAAFKKHSPEKFKAWLDNLRAESPTTLSSIDLYVDHSTIIAINRNPNRVSAQDTTIDTNINIYEDNDYVNLDEYEILRKVIDNTKYNVIKSPLF